MTSAKRKKIVMAAFLITAILVVIQWLLIQGSAGRPNKVIWWAFYLSCLFVILYGVKSAALEVPVYLITIIGEAIAPDLVERLISRLPDATISHPVLIVTAHLTLTLMTCTILLGWGLVLSFRTMGAGSAPALARLYVLTTTVVALVVIIWAAIEPAEFIGLDAATNGVFIGGVWPSMIDSRMSYVRILLTIATMFLPWVKASMDAGPNNRRVIAT